MTHQMNSVMAAALSGYVSLWSGIALAGPEDEARAALVAGNTEFALDLYARLRTEEGNLILSPYSISTALAMTYAGARTETARQMADVLHFPSDQDRLHPAFAALESTVNEASEGPGCTLHVANALWGQRGCGFLDEYLAVNREYYGATFRQVDFAQDTEEARKTINGWVADQTEKRIRELLLKEDLDPAVVLVLTNAIYFKGTWARQFDPQDTKDAPFHIDTEQDVTVPMMAQTGRFAFANHDEVYALELPYAGDRLSMVLLVPKTIDGLPLVEQSLNKESLDRWVKRWRHNKLMRVRLPRFKVNFRTDLARTLEAMGMTDAFSPGKADFSGMTGQRDLFIDAVIHQAQVEVNEEGTEAAAATAVVMKRGPAPVEFVVDHPFLYLIRDKQSGSILFMGRVVNPTA